MRLQNTSRYPTDEVRRLVTLATRGINLDRVAVHVKNSKYGYAGRAYCGVPSESPRAGQSTVDYLIVVRIGAPYQFPCDNMVERTYWIEVPVEEAYQAGSSLFRWSGKPGQERPYSPRIESHPYGGKSSPYIQMADWREALVCVAAHEARHIHQYRHGKPRSEVDCERFAAKAVERYRETAA